MRKNPARRVLVLSAAGALAAAVLSAAPAASALAQALPDIPDYSLPLAVQESLYFYDAQKSGPATTPQRPGAPPPAGEPLPAAAGAAAGPDEPIQSATPGTGPCR